MAAKYLFDANTFVQAKDREYQFQFANEFWDWIIAAHANGRVFSVQKVLDEINRAHKTCPAKAWAATVPPGFFLADTKDVEVMKHYATVMNWAANHTQYSDKAKSDFADPQDADAFLIASAMRHGMEICSHEVAAPECRRKIPLPNAAAAFGIKTVHVFDVLSAHATSPFKFKA